MIKSYSLDQDTPINQFLENFEENKNSKKFRQFGHPVVTHFFENIGWLTLFCEKVSYNACTYQIWCLYDKVNDPTFISPTIYQFIQAKTIMSPCNAIIAQK